MSLQLFLLCLPQSSCCAFLCGFEVPLSWLISSPIRFFPRMCVSFLFHSSLSGVLVLSCFLSLPFFFFLLFFPVIWRVSCPFWRFNVFFQCSVDVLCKSFYMYMVFLLCLWEKVSAMSYSSTIFFFFPLGPHLQHMKTPRLGVESELQLLAYPEPQQYQIQVTSATIPHLMAILDP